VLTTGGRRGELLGLREERIDLAALDFWFRKNYVVKGGAQIEKTPKSGKGRHVSEDPLTCELIGGYLERRRARMATVGVEVPRTAFHQCPQPIRDPRRQAVTRRTASPSPDRCVAPQAVVRALRPRDPLRARRAWLPGRLTSALPRMRPRRCSAQPRYRLAFSDRLATRLCRPQSRGDISCLRMAHDVRASEQHAAVHVVPVDRRGFDHVAWHFRGSRHGVVGSG
jgi:hypothetical protein